MHLALKHLAQPTRSPATAKNPPQDSRPADGNKADAALQNTVSPNTTTSVWHEKDLGEVAQPQDVEGTWLPPGVVVGIIRPFDAAGLEALRASAEDPASDEALCAAYEPSQARTRLEAARQRTRKLGSRRARSRRALAPGGWRER